MPALFEMRHLIEEPPAQWLGTALVNKGALVGYDPWLHTPQEVERLRAWRRARRARRLMRGRGTTRSDRVWPGRPPPPLAPVEPHFETVFAGQERRGEAA